MPRYKHWLKHQNLYWAGIHWKGCTEMCICEEITNAEMCIFEKITNAEMYADILAQCLVPFI